MRLGAVELLRRRACKCRDALRVGEGGVEFGGRGAEFVVGGDGRGVDVCLAGGGGGCGCSLWLGLSLGGMREVLGRREAAGRVCVGGVLEGFAVLSDHGWADFGEFGAQLGGDLGPDEVLDGLL